MDARAIPGAATVPPHRDALTQAALDRTAVALMGFDAGRRVVLCNQAAAAMLGLAAWCGPQPVERFLAGCGQLDAAGRLAFVAALRRPEHPWQTMAGAAADRRATVTLIDGRALHLNIGEAAGDQCVATLDCATGVPAERIDSLTGLSD